VGRRRWIPLNYLTDAPPPKLVDKILQDARAWYNLPDETENEDVSYMEIDNVRRQISLLTDKLMALESAPDLDALPVGTVIKFAHATGSRSYAYAAIKVEREDRSIEVIWYTTSVRDVKVATSRDLIAWLGMDVATIVVMVDPGTITEAVGVDPAMSETLAGD
jgi:hypothetical protein